ncbi:MAG TPA: hypothetical protein VEZ40_03545, partial [Pyrinomonadaceae bacterium]|nr:hypothetical protein [Pyrinomonadaceae bacterium]
MRKTALALTAFMLAQTFCLRLQQTFAAPFQGNTAAATTDIADSEAYYQAALRTAPPARDHTARINELLSRMTVEEKVGQMTQLEIGMVTTGQDQNIRIDPAKLEKAIVQYGV